MTRPRVATPAGFRPTPEHPAGAASTPVPRDVLDHHELPDFCDVHDLPGSPTYDVHTCDGHACDVAPESPDSPASANSPDQRVAPRPDQLVAPRPEPELPHSADNPDDSSASYDVPDLPAPPISDTLTRPRDLSTLRSTPSLSALPAQGTAPHLSTPIALSTSPDPCAPATLSAPLTPSAASAPDTAPALIAVSALTTTSPALSAASHSNTASHSNAASGGRYVSPTLSASPNPHDPGHSDLLRPRNVADNRGTRMSREAQSLRGQGQPTRVVAQSRVQSPARTPQPRSGLPRSGPARTPGSSVARTYSANPPRQYRTGSGGNVPLRHGTQRTGGNNLGPLTGLGVSLMLGAACAGGALLDMFLVGGPAWALTVVYIAACGYTATRVRRVDWFSALVSPPLAFAVAVVMLATLMPSSFGPGALGVLATTFTLLAAKAKALYIGNAVSAGVLFTRRVKARRAIPNPRPAS